MLSQNEFNQLRLIRSANIGPVSFVQLIRRFGDAGRALEALPELAAKGGGRAPRIAEEDAVRREVERAQTLNARYLFLGSTAYPALLAELNDAPPAILYRGDLSLLQRPAVAIVGARNASAIACRFARDLADNLSREGITVVSGLARGIDTAAHQGSLRKGTVGVIAGGVDVYFPPENQELQENIADQGLLIAEQPPGTEPRARHFPYRNRIIAGLSAGTVVIEAAPRSGSLITARLAGEAGRHVMAVPGSPLDPRSRGCNSLIREGATLIQSADDVLELIRDFSGSAPLASQSYDLFDKSGGATLREDSAASLPEPDDNARKRITDLLSITPVAVDELVRQSNTPARDVQTILLELELAGRLVRHAAGRVALESP